MLLPTVTRRQYTIMKKYTAIFTAPYGKMGIILENRIINKLEFLPPETEEIKSDNAECKKIIADIKAYFKNPHHEFQSEFAFMGTDFQIKVWQALLKIPVGKTLTYGQLAKKLKTGPRAIGQACRTNPVPLFVPCHRIVATDHLGGFAGQIKGPFFAAKQWLLRHEGAA